MLVLHLTVSLLNRRHIDAFTRFDSLKYLRVVIDKTWNGILAFLSLPKILKGCNLDQNVLTPRGKIRQRTMFLYAYVLFKSFFTAVLLFFQVYFRKTTEDCYLLAMSFIRPNELLIKMFDLQLLWCVLRRCVEMPFIQCVVISQVAFLIFLHNSPFDPYSQNQYLLEFHYLLLNQYPDEPGSRSNRFPGQPLTS